MRSKPVKKRTMILVAKMFMVNPSSNRLANRLNEKCIFIGFSYWSKRVWRVLKNINFHASMCVRTSAILIVVISETKNSFCTDFKNA